MIELLKSILIPKLNINIIKIKQEIYAAKAILKQLYMKKQNLNKILFCTLLNPSKTYKLSFIFCFCSLITSKVLNLLKPKAKLFFR